MKTLSSIHQVVTFHTNLVRPYIKNDDILFPKRDTKVFYNFGNDKDQEWLVEEILAHKWTNNNLELQVTGRWETSHGNR